MNLCQIYENSPITSLAQILLFFTFASNFPLHPSHRRDQVTLHDTSWSLGWSIQYWCSTAVLNISFLKLNLGRRFFSKPSSKLTVCIYIYSISYSVEKAPLPSTSHLYTVIKMSTTICSLVQINWNIEMLGMKSSETSQEASKICWNFAEFIVTQN